MISSISAWIVALRRRIARQKDTPGAVIAGRGQRDPEVPRLLAEKLVRHLDEDAGAVAGVYFAATGAAMEQIDEELKCLLDDGVRAHPFDVHDEANAARVFFVCGS